MQRDYHIAVWLRMLAEKEIRAARNAKSLLVAQGKNIANVYTKDGQSEVERIIKQGLNDWARVLVANYSVTLRDFIDYTNEQLGVGQKSKKSNFTDRMQAFIAREAYKKSDFITQTSLKVVRQTIGDGVTQGLGESEIAKNLKTNLGGKIANSRARIIARTEVHNAATYAMQAAAEESKQNLTREWVSVHDERTRDWHAEVDGQQVGIDEPFYVNGEYIDRPGEGSAENAINCRCTLIYSPESS